MDKQKIKSVPRLTTNNPGNNFQTALNFTDVSEDGWVWLRQPEIALTEYARQLVKGHGSSIDLNCNDMELSESLTDHLFDDPKQSIDGLIAEHYTILWAYATLREKLKWYEDAGIPVIPNYGLSTIRRAINRYGTAPQLQMAIKEMSELTKAICNLQRAVTFNYRNGAKIKVAHESVREEIAMFTSCWRSSLRSSASLKRYSRSCSKSSNSSKATWTAGRCKVSKAVLLSVRPNWCKLIWAGMKTVEVRKTCPKLETPFKVYIYCSGNSGWLMRSPKGLRKMDRKVIGEFVCDEVYKVDRDSVGFNFTAPSLDLPVYTMPENNDEYRNIQREELTTCLTDEQLSKYLGIHPGWGWHISNLKIYDRPLDLRELTGLQETRFGMRPVEITSPPQSWRYVEDAECTS